MFKLFVLLILFSCKKPQKFVHNYKYPKNLYSEDTKICKKYWEESLKLPEKKQQDCIVQNNLGYFSINFTNKVEETCSLYSFESFVMNQNQIEECINHLKNPKFKIGDKVSIKNNQFGNNCYGVVLKSEYKSTYNKINNLVFDKIYSLDIYCGEIKVLDSKYDKYIELEKNIFLL